MKAKIVTCVLTLIAIVGIAGVTVNRMEEIKVNAETTVVQTEPLTESAIEEVYILRENNGTLGVYDENENFLYEYEFNVNSLPETDVEILKKGLVLHGISELRNAIEDYTS